MVKHMTIIKLTVVVIFVVLTSRSLLPLLSINGLYSWLSAGERIFMAHIAQDGITFHTPFTNQLWIHQLYCL